MTDKTVLDLAAKTMWVSMQVAAPALLATLFMGILISVFQAATQINEQTLSFIPKILAMTVAILVFGPWTLQVMMNFTIELIQGIPALTH